MKRRADGRYIANYTIKDANGKSKVKSFYGKSPQEVRRKMLAFTGEQAKGRPLKEVCADWQNDHNETIRHNTQVCYKKPIEDVLEAFGEISIRQLTTLDIETFLEKLGKKGFARQTVKVRLIVLNQICKYGLRNGDLSTNPAAAAQLPRWLTAEKRAIAPDAALKKIDTLDTNGFGLFPILLHYTGCRRCEALALNWEDIDVKNRIIRITKEIEYHGNVPHVVYWTKSDAGVRNIIIRKKLLDALPKGIKRGCVFTNKNGELMSKGEFEHAWDKLELGITPHQLRHAYVTDLFEAGVPAEVAMTQTGHSDIKTMRGIYTHIRESQLTKATTLLDTYDEPPAVEASTAKKQKNV